VIGDQYCEYTTGGRVHLERVVAKVVRYKARENRTVAPTSFEPSTKMGRRSALT
jgi:hypothetical protein